MPPDEPQKPQSSRFWKWLAGIAAAVAAVIGAVFLWNKSQGEKSTDRQNTPTTAPELPKEVVRVDVHDQSIDAIREVAVVPGKLMEIHFHSTYDPNLIEQVWIKRKINGAKPKFPDPKPIQQKEDILRGYMGSQNDFIIVGQASYTDGKKIKEERYSPEEAIRITLENGKITSDSKIVRELARKIGSDIYEFEVLDKDNDPVEVVGRLSPDKKTIQAYHKAQSYAQGLMDGGPSYLLDPPVTVKVTSNPDGGYKVNHEDALQLLEVTKDGKFSRNRALIMRNYFFTSEVNITAGITFEEIGEHKIPLALSGEMDKSKKIYHGKKLEIMGKKETFDIDADIPLDNGHLIPESIPALRKAVEQAKEKAKEQGIDLGLAPQKTPSPEQSPEMLSAIRQFEQTKIAPFISEHKVALPAAKPAVEKNNLIG